MEGELTLESRLLHVNADETNASYDPYFEGEANKPTGTSTVGAVFSVVCTTVGAGILSLPFSLGKGGWFSLILIVLIALLSAHTAKLLIACMHAVEDQGRRLKNYEEIGTEALGPWGGRAVAFFQSITLFGVCTIFLILIGDSMHSLVPQLTLHVWIFIFGALLIPFAWLKTIEEIAVLAMFGVLASVLVGMVVVVEGFKDASSSVNRVFIDWDGLPTAFNILVFSFGSHSVLPAIEHTMRRPENFPKVANLSYIIIAVIYVVVSAAGYSAWGSSTADNVLKNMDAGSAVVKVARAFITAHVVMAYPIPLNPVSRNLEWALGMDKWAPRKELYSRIALRTLLVLLTVFIASVVPFFGDILSLVSAISIVLVAFVFPPWFYYLLFHRTNKRPLTVAHQLYLVLIVCIGLVGSVIGIYFSVKALVDDIEKNPNPFDGFFTD